MTIDYCLCRSNEVANNDFEASGGHTHSVLIIPLCLGHCSSCSTGECCCLLCHEVRAEVPCAAEVAVVLAGENALADGVEVLAASPGDSERREKPAYDLLMDNEQRIHESVSKEFAEILRRADRHDRLSSGFSSDTARNTRAPRGAETPIARFKATITEHVDRQGGVVTREGFPGKKADLGSDVRLRLVRLFADKEDGLQEWKLRAEWKKESPDTIDPMFSYINQELKKVGLRIKGAKHEPRQLISVQAHISDSPGTTTR
ncbi:MAG: hypothetical protein HQ567_31345 [Candidatus Nealsonbacteria bacterium]|nr:hypothetical protein [Candidatus Nealsonbacteria bacterium]